MNISQLSLKVFSGSTNDLQAHRTFLRATLNQFNEELLSQKGLEQLEAGVRDIYQNVYPDAKLVAVDSASTVSAHGAIHCLTNPISRFSDQS